ncbi:transcriptional regulator [Rhizobium phaseoli]|nr:transcriptional regulator [Rhizobium phaseoli]RDJ00902.1 transcriptional regulator [Rhizobium phaseoli]
MQAMIQSIERAYLILVIIAREGGAAKLKHISEKAKLTKSTTHNILKTFASLGLVKRGICDTQYHLGAGIQNISRATGDDNALKGFLRPTLQRIAEKSKETVYLAVLNGDEVSYLDAIESTQMLSRSRPIGGREPVSRSAIGQIFLAFVPGLFDRVKANPNESITKEIQEQVTKVANIGYSVALDAIHPDVNCVAVPWRQRGEVRAAIGLSGPSARLASKALTSHAIMMIREVEQSFARTTN